MMTQLPDSDENGYFTGDRYDRLTKCAEIVAADPGIENADSMFNGPFIRTYVRELVEHKVLDGLSERDSNTVGMLVVLDARLGPDRIASRIAEWLNGKTIGRDGEEDNPWAVCAALAFALKIMLDAFVEAFTDEVVQ